MILVRVDQQMSTCWVSACACVCAVYIACGVTSITHRGKCHFKWVLDTFINTGMNISFRMQKLNLFILYCLWNGNGPNDLCEPMLFKYLLIIYFWEFYSRFAFNLLCALYAISEKYIYIFDKHEVCARFKEIIQLFASLLNFTIDSNSFMTGAKGRKSCASRLMQRRFFFLSANYRMPPHWMALLL